MKVKTSELSGVQLDYAVAYSVDWGQPVLHITSGGSFVELMGVVFSPTTNWSQCGPLIQQFQIGFFHPCIGGVDKNGELRDCLQATIGYRRTISGENAEARSYEHDYLVAACRAVVIAKLGDEVDIPDELMEVGE